MWTLIKHRIFQLILVVWGVGTLTFVLMRSLPGDMAYRIAASRYGQDSVDSAAAELVRQELGLDASWWQSYAQWLTDLVQFNLGKSLVSGLPVIETVQHQLGHSVLLAFTSVLLASLIAIFVGVLSAFRQGTLDHGFLWLSTLLRSMPVFVIGLMLILIFSVAWPILPVAGFGTWQHLVLPTLALALSLAAVSNRVVRNNTLRIIRAPFYQFAAIKGLSTRQTFVQHGIRNISVPVIAFIGIQLVTVIEGIVMIESLFSWPGIGHGLAHAIFARDIPVIQGCALMMGILFVLLNTCVDLLCHWIDPRGAHA
ncbi:ABC transporter permease [Marinomonas pollencensis]|uniref:Peptide/nickel transport system permease protein n=1 Tax=Marinomonas pollencensis TaxID=491954 RepID=A0A3E0DH95_9GAMM|nr:ABC transporter permease [Marinomonas pollencensis]REG81969.1 peptide/nickel transport system permease protein [Marinomonas pollencensis]